MNADAKNDGPTHRRPQGRAPRTIPPQRGDRIWDI